MSSEGAPKIILKLPPSQLNVKTRSPPKKSPRRTRSQRKVPITTSSPPRQPPHHNAKARGPVAKSANHSKRRQNGKKGAEKPDIDHGPAQVDPEILHDSPSPLPSLVAGAPLSAAAHTSKFVGTGAKPAKSNKAVKGPTDTGDCSWTEDDMWDLVNFLNDHASEAGDGFAFTIQTYNQAAIVLNKKRTRGGLKTGNACKTKWHNYFWKTYHIVQALIDASGFHWDMNTGATITEASESVWKDYVKKHPGASEFKNKGWLFYSDVKKLMPVELQGKHVCHPGQLPVPDPSLSADPFREFSPPWDLTIRGLDGNEPLEPLAAPDIPPSANQVLTNLDGSDRSSDEDKTILQPPKKHKATPGVTPAPPSKRVRLSGGAVMMGKIGENLDWFNTLFEKAFSANPGTPSSTEISTPYTPTPPASSSRSSSELAPATDIFSASPSKRRARTIQDLERQELWMSDVQVLDFVGLLEMDQTVSDIYISMTCPALRTAYVKQKLGITTQN